jgi:hypothetical protein
VVTLGVGNSPELLLEDFFFGNGSNSPFNILIASDGVGYLPSRWSSLRFPCQLSTLGVPNSPKSFNEDCLAKWFDFTKNLRFEPRPLGSQREATNA